LLASYHTHTVFSDGHATVAAMLEAARAQGLDEIGISDHWTLDPRGASPRWSMDVDRLGAYVAEIEAARREAGPRLRLGLEVDWFPGHGDAIAAGLGDHAFDYLIGSVHVVDGFPIDTSREGWDALRVEARDAVHRGYWRAIASLARSGLFDVVGHLDLPKKFRQRPSVDLGADVEAALDAIAAADLAVELNTSGWFAPCADAYPSADLVRACRARSIPMLLTADAHRPEHLVRAFDRGAERLREAGYEEIVVFEGRVRRTAPMPFADRR